MAYSFSKNFPTSAKNKEPIKNNDTGKMVYSGAEYTIMSNAEALSQSGLQTELSANAGVQEATASLFDTFGIAIAEDQSSHNEFTLMEMETENSETIDRTSDENPNVQSERVTKLRPRKVPASEIFNQTTDNPINEADDCQPQQYRDKKNKRSQKKDISEMALDLLNEAQEDLQQIYGIYK
jgi:hypothetical protein